MNSRHGKFYDYRRIHFSKKYLSDLQRNFDFQKAKPTWQRKVK